MRYTFLLSALLSAPMLFGQNALPDSLWQGSPATLLFFTHTWCAPCWAAYEPLRAAEQSCPEQLSVWALHLDTEQKDWLKIANRKGVSAPLRHSWEAGRNQAWADALGYPGIPFFVLLDASGNVQKRWLGARMRKLRRTLRKACRPER